MSEIILDCDLMKYPNSGLYHYCLNIGEQVSKLLEKEQRPPVKMYLPPKGRVAIEKQRNFIFERKWHKVWKPFLNQCRIWHAPFQTGRIIPDKQKDKNVKVVLTIHDLNPLHEGKPRECQQRSLQHTQELIDRSDTIVCISDFTKNDVLTHCNVGNKPVHVIHNGTHKLADPALSRESYQPVRPFLFGMGYLNTKKNFHVLLTLLVHNPDIDLIIAGRHDDPEYVAAMQVKAEELKVSDRLHLPGPVSEEEKSWYLSNCMAFVHPSLAEGFGAPVVEAMKFGKPLFLSNRTSLPEIGGDVSFYFSSFNEHHMQSVFQTGMAKFKAENMSGQVIARGAKFNWEQSAEKYLNVYKSLY